MKVYHGHLVLFEVCSPLQDYLCPFNLDDFARIFVEELFRPLAVEVFNEIFSYHLFRVSGNDDVLIQFCLNFLCSFHVSMI